MKITGKGLKNAAKAAAHVTQQIVSGEAILVDKDTTDRRLATCHACPRLAGKQCSLCECLVKLKVMFKDETCPDNPPRW